MGEYVVHHLEAEQKAELVEAFARAIAGETQVAFACLYGSVIERQDVRDIDVGVYLKPTAAAPPGGIWRLEARLGETLEAVVARIVGERIPVDVRVMNQAPLPAQFAVLTGEVIHIGDSDDFARVVEDVAPRYLDLQPLREQALRDVLSA